MLGALYYSLFPGIFCLSVVAYSAKKYKMAIFRHKPSQFWIFWPRVTYSYRSHLCKTPEPNVSSLLHTFKQPMQL
jgi:hypothetical protein